VALPIPEVPPVTSATLPENVLLFIVFLSLICVTREVVGQDGKIRPLDLCRKPSPVTNVYRFRGSPATSSAANYLVVKMRMSDYPLK
jgi:hypothetical protein